MRELPAGSFLQQPSRNSPALLPTQMQTDPQQIICALALSLRAQNQQDITQATHILSTQQYCPNFLPTLLDLSISLFHNQNNEKLAMSALAQVKNFVRGYWRVHSPQTECPKISPEDRQVFLSRIWQANLLLSENYRSSKLMKDVISMVGKEAQDHLEAAYELLQTGKQLRAVLNYLLGVLASLHNCIQEEHRSRLKLMIQHFLPAIYDLIKEGERTMVNLYDEILVNPNSLGDQQLAGQVDNFKLQKLFFDEIVYLGVKFAAKALQEKMTKESEEALLDLAQVAMNRMGEEGAVQEEESDRKGSSSFNFVHAKKWSCRFMSRFLNTVVVRRGKQTYRPAALHFIQNQEPLLLQILANIIPTPQPHKLKMEELRLLQTVVKVRSEVYTTPEAQPQRMLYLSQYLPEFIRLHPSALEFLSSCPHEHMQGEDISLRKKAATTWTLLALHNQSDEAISAALSLMKVWSETDRASCEMVSYLLLFCNEVMGVEEYRSEWQPFINAHLSRIFQTQDYLLLATGLEVLMNFDEWVTLPTVQLAKFAILHVLLGGEQPNDGEWVVARLRAAVGLRIILQSRANQLTQQQAQKLMGVLVEAVSIYQSDQIMSTLRTLVEVHGQSVQGMAVELAELMGSWAISYISNETELKFENDYNEKTYYIALSTLDVITSLCALQVPQTARAARSHTQRSIGQAVEKQLVAITISVFTKRNLEQHLERVMYAIATYLNHCSRSDELSPELWFCFHLCVYRVCGLSKRARIAVLKEHSPQADALRTCFKPDSFNMNFYLVAIRAFLDFVRGDLPTRSGREIAQNLLEANDLEKVYYMVVSFYQKVEESTTKEHRNISDGRVLSTLTLVYLLECHAGDLHQTLLVRILNIIIINSKTPHTLSFMIKYNMQLLLTWFWALQHRAWPTLLQHFADKPTPAQHAEELLSKVLVSHERYGLRELQSVRELKRAIAGLCSLIMGSLLLSKQSKTNSKALGFSRIHTYINWMFYYVRNSLDAEAREYDSDYESEEEPENEQHQREIINDKHTVFVDDDDSEYGCSKMQEVDEVQLFLDFLLQLQKITPEGYRNIITATHNKKVRNLLVDTENFSPPYCSLYDYEQAEYEEEEASV